MNEKRKVLIVLAFIASLILMIVLVGLIDIKKSEKLYNQFEQAFNGDTNTLVYIGRPSCGYCNLLTPSLDDMEKRYDFDYIYINTDSFSSSYLNKVLEKLNIETLKTPYLAIVSNGKIVDIQNGYADYDKTFEFLQKNSVIDKEAELLLNYIDLGEYKEILSSNEKSVVVVGQSTCSYCISAKIILNEIADEKDITINYLNISYLTSEEGKEFEESLDYLQENNWGTPIMLILQNNKMVDIIPQLASKADYIKFLEENGVL